MSKRVLVTIGGFAKEARSILEENGLRIDCRTLSKEELTTAIGSYDALIIGIEVEIDRTILNAARDGLILATVTTGLDHIDTAYAKKRGIRVLSLNDDPEFLRGITATAELALGLLLALVRNIPTSAEDVRNGNWRRTAFTGHSLLGKKLGIVGKGRIGSMMETYGRALGMKVLCVSKNGGDVSFDELLSQSDVISIHVPLTEETERMFGASAFRKMKNTAVLINTARGKIVDEKALLDALEKKKIAGYAADVLGDELLFGEDCSGNALIKYAKTHRNVLITPHIGGMTEEARTATDIFMTKRVCEALQA